METTFFIASKPLQVVNSMNIPCNGSKKLLLCDGFSNCNQLLTKLQQQKYFDEIVLVNGPLDALKYCFLHKEDIKTIYTPSDYGLQIGFWLHILRNKQIMVYEEGLGNYEPDFAVKHRLTRYIHILLSFKLDIDMYFGASPYIDGVILYKPDYFKMKYPKFNKPIMHFKYNFSELLQKDLIKEIFRYNPPRDIINKDVLLYLSTWKINENIEKYVSEYNDYVKIIKPHPHIKNIGKYIFFDIVINDNILAEIVISELLKTTRNLVIIHENSTAVLNYKNTDKLSLINIV